MCVHACMCVCLSVCVEPMAVGVSTDCDCTSNAPLNGFSLQNSAMFDVFFHLSLPLSLTLSLCLSLSLCFSPFCRCPMVLQKSYIFKSELAPFSKLPAATDRVGSPLKQLHVTTVTRTSVVSQAPHRANGADYKTTPHCLLWTQLFTNNYGVE